MRRNGRIRILRAIRLPTPRRTYCSSQFVDMHLNGDYGFGAARDGTQRDERRRVSNPSAITARTTNYLLCAALILRNGQIVTTRIYEARARRDLRSESILRENACNLLRPRNDVGFAVSNVADSLEVIKRGLPPAHE